MARIGTAVLALGLSLRPDVMRATAVQSDQPDTPVELAVDGRNEHQTMYGFGAAHRSVAEAGDDLGDELRHRVLDAVYGQVGLTTGYLDAALIEGAGDHGQRGNDDDDPSHLNWSGFQTSAADAIKRFVLERPEAAAFTDFVLGQRINTRWASPWLGNLRAHDFQQYLDEAAEQVAAGLIYYRDTLKVSQPYDLLFNEPTSGNGEVGPDRHDVVELIKRVGARMRREGFPDVKFVVPNEETEEASLAVASAILQDSQARQYVGAIGYHTYPYGSPYSSIPAILSSADKGEVNDSRRSVRRQLADLADRYRLPLWMTEVSHGDVDARSFDDLRGRAIHIHDELEYADASAYFGMFSIWDSTTDQRHYGDGHNVWSEEGSVVMVDQRAELVQITGMGYAIGHYARWIKRGAIRLDLKSSDRLVLASAFRDDAARRLVLVVINNSRQARPVRIRVKGLHVSGDVTGERSTAAAPWVALDPSAIREDGDWTLNVPALSVTTVAAGFADRATIR